MMMCCVSLFPQPSQKFHAITFLTSLCLPSLWRDYPCIPYCSMAPRGLENPLKSNQITFTSLDHLQGIFKSNCLLLHKYFDWQNPVLAEKLSIKNQVSGGPLDWAQTSNLLPDLCNELCLWTNGNLHEYLYQLHEQKPISLPHVVTWLISPNPTQTCSSGSRAESYTCWLAGHWFLPSPSFSTVPF